MTRICAIAFGLALVMQSASVRPSAQGLSRIWWIANFVDAGLGAVGSVYYDRPSALTIQLWIKNEDGDRTIVAPYSFRELLTINVSKDGQPVEIAVTWEADTRQLPSRISMGLVTDLSLEQDGGFEALCEVRRKDGSLFDPGSYVLSVLMHPLRQQLRFGDATPWSGVLNEEGKFHFEVRPVTNQQELRMSLALAARASMRKREYNQAIAQFQRVIAADQSDFEGHIGLGQAYMGLGRYPQAIAAYEQGLARLTRKAPQAAVIYPLAYAFVATGQAVKAAGVLRLVLPVDRISAEIDNIRKRLPR